MELAEVKSLDAKRRNVQGHLRIWRAKMPGFQAHVAEEVKDGFSALCRRLAVSLSDLVVNRRRGIGSALNDSMALLREALAAFEIELVASSPNIAGNSNGNQ